MLSSVPQLQEAVMCFTGKMHVLEKLHSDMSDSVFGCEFNVNELRITHDIISLNKKTQETRLCIDWLTKTL